MVEFIRLKPGRDWAKELSSLAAVFALPVAWPGKGVLQKTSDRITATLEKDIEILKRDMAFAFSVQNDLEDLTEQNINLLRKWHMGEDAPSLTALCIFAMDYWRPDLSTGQVRAVLAASVLGEVESNLSYHSNMHFRKVLLQTIRMIAVHNNIYEGTARAFDGWQIGLLMLAACIHDLGHDGFGNTIKGEFQQGRLEQQSFELALPYLEASGMNDPAELDAIKVMILCTDVTPLGDPASPANQMKAAYRYHFLEQRKKLGSLNLDRSLSALERNPDLTMMALILHEADIATSAGLGYVVTAFETVLHGKEVGHKDSSPQDILDFLRDVCQRQMLSDAGQELYAGNMARIYALAEKDVKEGNSVLPEIEYADLIRVTASNSRSDSKTIN